MFKWLKNNLWADQGKNEAFKTGQDFANMFMADIDRVSQAKFSFIEQRYTELFSKSLTDIATNSPPIPPILFARHLYSQYLGEVEKAEDGIRAEIQTDLSQYKKVFSQVNMDELFETAINNKIGNFGERLRHKGLETLANSADFLTELDNAWRIKNPEKSAEFPTD